MGFLRILKKNRRILVLIWGDFEMQSSWIGGFILILGDIDMQSGWIGGFYLQSSSVSGIWLQSSAGYEVSL